MPLPEVRLLGQYLPLGWQRPTEGLVRQYKQFQQEGLAAPHAPQLYRPAVDVKPHELTSGRTAQGIRQLERYVKPGGSPLKAVGMAYPQLALAQHHSIRALAAQTDMSDLRAVSRRDKVAVLVNPSYTPVKSSGQQLRVEACFSAPGIGVRVHRWREVILYANGGSLKVSGTYAWILQHEADHLDGVLCTTVARRQGFPLYYVPPEWYSLFVGEGLYAGWPTMPWSQYEAMKGGDFDLATYFNYL